MNNSPNISPASSEYADDDPFHSFVNVFLCLWCATKGCPAIFQAPPEINYHHFSHPQWSAAVAEEAKTAGWVSLDDRTFLCPKCAVSGRKVETQ
jgi:hypothetical protein